MSGPRDARPSNRRASRPNSCGTTGRLAGLYGYEHYEVTDEGGGGWSVSRRAPFRFDGTYEPTGTPSAQDWEQAREQYRRQQQQRLDRQADRLIGTHPDLTDLDHPSDDPADSAGDGPGDTEQDR